jgi:hypothetical protein
MAESDLELHAKFGLPDIGQFSAKLEARYRRSWTSRNKEFIDLVDATAGLSPHERDETLVGSDSAADLYLAAGQRAVTTSDPEYRSALGRLVGAALRDQAQIHEIDHLTSQILRLEPLHLRALHACFRRKDDPLRPDPTVNVPTLAKRIDAEPALVESAVQVLRGAGFLESDGRQEDERISKMLAQGGTSPFTYKRWKVTPWGVNAMRLCFPASQDPGAG